MRQKLFFATLTIVFTAASAVYYYIEIDVAVDKIFLSIATFLFTIFTGFFISRQALRFNKLRETVTAFDGKMSTIYRASGHISADVQKQIGDIIKKRYKKIFSTNRWDVHFVDKSSTLNDIHTVLEENVVDSEVTKISNQSLGVVMKSLAVCQDLRKLVVAYRKERIPGEQWILLLFFTVILIVTVSLVPSSGLLFASLLKAAFVVSILSVIWILYTLNNLQYSETLMGAQSAQDVVDIIKGKR